MTNDKRSIWPSVGNIAGLITIAATMMGINEKILGPIRGNLFFAIVIGFLIIILVGHIFKGPAKLISIIIAICFTAFSTALFASTYITTGFAFGDLAYTSNPIRLKTAPSYTISANPQLGDSVMVGFAVPQGYSISVTPDTLEEPDHKPTCDAQNVSKIKKDTGSVSLLFKDTSRTAGCKVKIVTDSDSIFITYDYYKRSKIQRISQCLVHQFLYFRW